MSLSTVHLILKKHFESPKCFCWMLTDEQNRQRVEVAKKLLQLFQTYYKEQFAYVVAVDENWVYYFEPVRKVSHKVLATKHSRRPIIVKSSLSARKV